MMSAKNLRDSILQMAVEGKLVEQREEEGTAADLLASIREQRAQLVREKKAKPLKGGESVIWRDDDGHWFERRGKGGAVCIDDEIPFDIPDSWCWARLDDMGDWKAGATPKKDNDEYYRGGEIPWLLTGDLNDGHIAVIPHRITEKALQECSLRLNPAGTLLIAMYGATIGKVGILDFPATTNQACCACILYDYNIKFWVYYFLLSNKKIFMKLGAGGAQPNISRGKIISCLIPIPPLGEQRRIVAKIEELLPLFNEYGEVHERREQLDRELPIKLRKSILQAAVEGKLTEQSDDDEPASLLLAGIREKRAQLVREGKAKPVKGGESVIYRDDAGHWFERRGKSDPVCINEEIPFDIPDSWSWARLNGLASFAGGKTPATADSSNYEENGILWVTSKDMKRDHIDSTLITLSTKGAADLTLYPAGTILMVTRSGILRRMLPVAILDKEATINQDQKAICPFSSDLAAWLFTYFKANDARIRREFGKSGTTVESINFNQVETMLVAIPPLAEQEHIVSKVDAALEQLNALR